MTTFLPITLLQSASRRFGAAFVAAVVSVIAMLLNSFPWYPAQTLLARLARTGTPRPSTLGTSSHFMAIS
jgi:hypothetical protein